MKNIAFIACFFLVAYLPNAMAMDRLTKKKGSKSTLSQGNKINPGPKITVSDIKKIVLEEGRAKALEKLNPSNSEEKNLLQILKNDKIATFMKEFIIAKKNYLFAVKLELENNASLCQQIAFDIECLMDSFPDMAHLTADIKFDSENPTLDVILENLEQHRKTYGYKIFDHENIINFGYVLFLDNSSFFDYLNPNDAATLMDIVLEKIQKRLVPPFTHITVMSDMLILLEKIIDSYCAKNYFDIDVRHHDGTEQFQHHEIARNNHLAALIREHKKLSHLQDIVRDRIEINNQSWVIQRKVDFRSNHYSEFSELFSAISAFFKKYDKFKGDHIKKIKQINEALPPRAQFKDTFEKLRTLESWSVTLDRYLYVPKDYNAPYRLSLREYQNLHTASGSQASTQASSPPSSPKPSRSRSLRRVSTSLRDASIGRSGSDSARPSSQSFSALSNSQDIKESDSVSSKSDASRRKGISSSNTVSSEINTGPSVSFNNAVIEMPSVVAHIEVTAATSSDTSFRGESKKNTKDDCPIRKRAKSETSKHKNTRRTKSRSHNEPETVKRLPKIVKEHTRRTSGSGGDEIITIE